VKGFSITHFTLLYFFCTQDLNFSEVTNGTWTAAKHRIIDGTAIFSITSGAAEWFNEHGVRSSFLIIRG